MDSKYLSSLGLPLAVGPALQLLSPEEASGWLTEASSSGAKPTKGAAPAPEKEAKNEAKGAASSKAGAKGAEPKAAAAAATPAPAAGTAAAGPKNFLQEQIEKDLADGGRCAHRRGMKGDVIRTRFPPEPNGYLHIGHAKSICINFGLAQKYGGRCHLRFDDTNPAAEETEYVESIQEDVKWLGFDWGENLYFASSYFDQLHEWAIHLIKTGKAFVDSESGEEMKAHRGNVTTPGTNSKFRDRSVEENLKLFEEMRLGKYEPGEHVLRCKIDMTSPNMNLRDPKIYRILKKSHHRTGDKWCIYPLYDFAHGQEDAIEGITHSICTMEFEDHRALYEWFTENLPIDPKPLQFEFNRLNVTNTVMSKRKLLKLVRAKVVDGWDDPRMPTICGMRRRGVPPSALRSFVSKVGVTKGFTIIDSVLLEETIREDLDPTVERRMVVLQPLKVVIEDYPEGKSEEVEAFNHPTKPEMGKRKMKFSREIWIEQDDFREDAPDSYFRLKPGGEVKLRYSYCIKVKDVIKRNGAVVELRCTHDPATRDDMPKDRKVKGVIHWVSAAHCAQMGSVRLYDYLLKVEGEEANNDDANDDQGEDGADDENDETKDAAWMKQLNPKSIVEIADAKAEACLSEAKPLERFQFERNAFFVVDKYSKDGQPIFNRIVDLKKSGLAAEEDVRTAARSRKDEQAKQAAEKEAKKNMNPRDMFKGQTDLYSAFDDDGVPTHGADGEALPKSRIKKLKAEWEKQKKLFESANK